MPRRRFACLTCFCPALHEYCGGVRTNGQEAGMMGIIADLPDNIIGIEAHGHITPHDYQRVFLPVVEARLAQHERLRLLFYIGDMEGFDLAALWEDVGFGLKHWCQFSHIAFVTDHGWIKAMSAIFAPLIPGDIRVYSTADLEKARAWVIVADPAHEEKVA